MMPRVLRLRGSAEEMGWQHGHCLKGEIHQRLQAAWSWWRRQVKNDGNQLRFLRLAHQMVVDFQRHGGQAWEEWRALAKAAQVSPEELILLTAWHDWAEVVQAQECVETRVGGCTAAILKAPFVPSGAWLAMTWDVPAPLGRHLHVFCREPEDGPRALVFAAAGGFPIGGVNEAGLAFLWVDRAYRPAEPRLPAGAIGCDLAHRSHFDVAVRLAKQTPQASGLALALADSSGHTLLVERGPHLAAEQLPAHHENMLVFANHYLAQALQSYEGWSNPEASRNRQHRLAERLHQVSSLTQPDQVRERFADHEPLAGESLCQHGSPTKPSSAAFLLAIADRAELWVNFGPPCQPCLAPYSFH